MQQIRDRNEDAMCEGPGARSKGNVSASDVNKVTQNKEKGQRRDRGTQTRFCQCHETGLLPLIHLGDIHQLPSKISKNIHVREIAKEMPFNMQRMKRGQREYLCLELLHLFILKRQHA